MPRKTNENATSEESKDLEGVSALRYRALLAFASTVSFASIVITFLVWLPEEIRPFGALVFLPVFLPYAIIPFLLYSRQLRSGLSWAMTMGGALFIPGMYLVWYAITREVGWWGISSLIVGLMMQPLLFIVALKAYMGLSRLPGDGVRLLADSVYGFLLFAGFLVYSPVPRYIAERNFPSGLIAISFILLGVLATYLIFRKTSGDVIIYRIPPFLTCAVPLLCIGLSSIPFASKPLFTKVIGHDIHAHWHEPIESVVFVLVPIGIVWALINAAMDRQRTANLLGLAIPLGGVVLLAFLIAAAPRNHMP
jgi:hypothetical protein